MQYYKLEISDINACSSIGIVATWSDDDNCAICDVCEKTTELFSEHEILIVE